MRRTMRWTEAPHGAITNGNHIGGARSTPTFDASADAKLESHLVLLD